MTAQIVNLERFRVEAGRPVLRTPTPAMCLAIETAASLATRALSAARESPQGEALEVLTATTVALVQLHDLHPCEAILVRVRDVRRERDRRAREN